MIASKHIAKAVVRLAEKYPEDTKHAENLATKLLQFIEKYNLQQQLPAILRDIHAENNKRKRERSVLISVPYSIDAIVAEKIRKYIGAPTGSSVEVTEDTEIIGGFLAYWQDRKVDGSVTHALEKLHDELLETV